MPGVLWVLSKYDLNEEWARGRGGARRAVGRGSLPPGCLLGNPAPGSEVAASRSVTLGLGATEIQGTWA